MFFSANRPLDTRVPTLLVVGELSSLLCKQSKHDPLDQSVPDVRYGTAAAIYAQRGIVLTAAYPERFGRTPPQPPALPTTSWINPPDQEKDATAQ